MAKVIPFGDRLLVKRRRIGEKLGKGIIFASQETKDRPIDIADVVHVPDHSFADKELINGAEEIIQALTQKAKEGSSEALVSLLRFNDYLNHKLICSGSVVFISKYIGTDFHDNQGDFLTLCGSEDVIGLVEDE